jgi:hypothetical protein
MRSFRPLPVGPMFDFVSSVSHQHDVLDRRQTSLIPPLVDYPDELPLEEVPVEAPGRWLREVIAIVGHERRKCDTAIGSPENATVGITEEAAQTATGRALGCLDSPRTSEDTLGRGYSFKKGEQ